MPWFRSKRFGWGLQPISWQGWALTIAYVAIAVTLGVTLASSRLWLFATLLVIVSALYLLFAYMTKE
jgi:hypothetical protein